MIALILVAGGKGERMGLPTPKQFLELAGKSVAQRALDPFLDFVDEVVVICEERWQERFLGNVAFAPPGRRRQESVQNGLRALSEKVELVVIHDAARPFVSTREIEEVIDAAKEHGAATVAIPVRYSVKEVDEEGFVTATLDRRRTFEVQTPQAMRRDRLEEGFSRGGEVTDEATLIEEMGYPVKVVKGEARNFKITTIEDLLLARQLVQQ